MAYGLLLLLLLLLLLFFRPLISDCCLTAPCTGRGKQTIVA